MLDVGSEGRMMKSPHDMRRRPRWTQLLRLAWAEGGRMQRFLVAYIASSPFVATAAVALITLTSGVGANKAVWIWFVALGGIVLFPAFQGPIYDSAYSLNFMKTTLSQDWMRPADREYYTELLRFRSTLGKDGHLEGDLAWALSYCTLYLATILASVTALFELSPILGEPVGVLLIIAEMGTGIAAGFAYSRRTIRLFKRAEAQGFRLLKLKRATRAPRLS